MTTMAAPVCAIRVAGPADAAAVGSLVDAFVRGTDYRDHVSTSHGALIERFLTGEVPDSVILLAVHQETGAIVGCVAALIYPNLITQRRTASEVVVWVEPEARTGAEVGPALMSAFEDWARAMGAEELHAVAWNPVLERWYRTLGLTKLETVYRKTLS